MPATNVHDPSRQIQPPAPDGRYDVLKGLLAQRHLVDKLRRYYIHKNWVAAAASSQRGIYSRKKLLTLNTDEEGYQNVADCVA
jgi:hypothetical protein